MKREQLEALELSKETIDKVMALHGAAMTDEVNKTKSAIAERDTLQGQLTEAQTAITGLEGKTQEEVKKALDEYKVQAETEKTELEKARDAAKYEAAVERVIAGEKFTSNSARTAYVDSLTKKALQFAEDGKNLLGYDDFRKEYATSDPGAFITEGGEDKNKTPARVNTGGEHTENTGSDDPFVAGAMKGAGLTSNEGA